MGDLNARKVIVKFNVTDNLPLIRIIIKLNQRTRSLCWLIAVCYKVKYCTIYCIFYAAPKKTASFNPLKKKPIYVMYIMDIKARAEVPKYKGRYIQLATI